MTDIIFYPHATILKVDTKVDNLLKNIILGFVLASLAVFWLFIWVDSWFYICFLFFKFFMRPGSGFQGLKSFGLLFQVSF